LAAWADSCPVILRWRSVVTNRPDRPQAPEDPPPESRALKWLPASAAVDYSRSVLSTLASTTGAANSCDASVRSHHR
jgi:hypothetical protein